MASSNSGPGIFEWILIGGAAWLAWNWWTSQSTAAAAPAGSSGGSSAPPCPSPGVLSNNVCTCPQPNTMINGVCTPPPTYVPPTLVQQLQVLAGASVTQLNADQWNYYLTQPSPQGLNQPSPANFTSAFFPQGRPAAGQTEQTMTAAQFVNALGLSGLGFPFRIVRGRGFGQVITMHDLRRAGGRY